MRYSPTPEIKARQSRGLKLAWARRKRDGLLDPADRRRNKRVAPPKPNPATERDECVAVLDWPDSKAHGVGTPMSIRLAAMMLLAIQSKIPHVSMRFKMIGGGN